MRSYKYNMLTSLKRYGRGSGAITGYQYEPWHIRYIGSQTAQEIYERNITLEEYLQTEIR